MLRVLIMGLLLRRARKAHPELFDGPLALAQVKAALADYGLGAPGEGL